MKRLLTFPLLTVVLTTAMAWPMTSAGAASSVSAGWWTSSPVPPPDVPSGGLAVQGGPDAKSPVAISAVSFALDPGESAQSVSLGVTANSGTTPSAQLMACPLTTPFSPASGGAMSNAPKYDCGSKATASPSSDGKTYTFDVSGIAATGALAIAILPTQPTDRVVFNAPTTSSLTSATSSASTTSESSPTLDSGSSSPAYSSAPSSGSSFEAPATPDATVNAPASGSLGGGETPRATTTGANAAASSPISSGSKSHSRVLVPVALGLALLAAVLWFSAGVGSGTSSELAEESG